MIKPLRRLEHIVITMTAAVMIIAGCDSLTREKVIQQLEGSTFSFADQDEVKGSVSGKIQLDASEELNKAVNQWVVYWSDAATERGKSVKICSEKITDGVICEVAEAKVQGEYMILYATNKEGTEFFTNKSVNVEDAFKEEEKPEEPEATEEKSVEDETPVVADETPAVDEAPAVDETPAVEETPVVEDPEPVTPDDPIEAVMPVTIMVENILYDFDRADIKDEYMTYLDETFESVENKETMTFVIAGHADERGSNEYNLVLGERRAYAVKRYLVSLGFPEENIKIMSYGEEKPADTGHDEAAWSRNRRAVTEVAQ